MSSAAASNSMSASGLGLLMGGDPLSMAVDLGGTILGLPPEVKNIAKIALGVASANPFMIFNGLQGLAQNAEQAAATEYKPPEYGAATGYAPSPSASQSRRREQITELASRRSRLDDPRCTDSPGGSQGAGGPVSFGPLPGLGGKLSHEDIAYYQSAAVLAANFTKAETAGFALRDGQLSMNDLRQIANDPTAHPELVKAALFFLEHPGRFMQMSMTTWTPLGPPMGAVSLEELRREVQKGVERGALVSNGGGSSSLDGISGGGCVGTLGGGASGGGGSSGTVGGGAGGVGAGGGSSRPDPLDAILNDPSLSASEKAEQILMQILMDLDGDMLGLLGEMREVRKKQAASAEDKEQSAELASDMELLQHKLQKVMERRTQMMTLLTNMSRMTHEAHMACINNTR